MKYYKLYITIIIIAFFAFSCGSESDKAEKYIERAKLLVDASPDSALILLDSVFYPEGLTKKTYNEFYLILVQAKDKADKDISQDSIIFKVKDYYIDNNDVEKAALACFYSGKVLKSQKEPKKAMNAFLDAESYVNQTNDNNLKGLIQSHIGYLYYNELLMNEALPRFKQAVDYFEKAQNYKNEAFTLRDIGNSFVQKKEDDSAFYYYQKGLKIADISKDSTCRSSIRHNIGLVFKSRGNFSKAKEYLNNAITYASSPVAKAKIYSVIAQILYSENKSDSAIYYFEKSLEILDKNKEPYLASRIYEHLSALEENEGKYSQALEYNKKRIESLYNIFEQNENQAILDIQKKYNYELIRNTNNRLLIQRQFLFIILLALVLSIVVIIFYSNLKNQKRERDLLKAERDLLEAEQKIGQLSQMAKSYNEKEDSFRDKLLRHFDILKKSALLEGFLRDDEKKHGEKLLKKFNEIVYNQTTQDWTVLYQTMNELHDGFFDSLRETFPQLDESEFKICCLIYADFTNSEISIIMGQSANTITAKRSIIRKKIGIKDYGNIIDYLNNMVKRGKNS